MAVDTVASLVDALRQNRLLEPAQLDELALSLSRRYREPRALAKVLLERAWLTPYQINQLFQGRPELLLGQYIILERLGESPLGLVYKARHQHMKRVVALKVIREDLLAQPEAVSRFYQQIQAISQLCNPYIVEAYDAGPIGRTHFFAMEYVEGIDLERLVQQSGPLASNQACDFIRQAALGLQHAFERGLLHYDVKPLNFLVTRRQTKVPKGADPSGQGSTQQSRTKAILKIRNLGLTLLQPHGSSSDEWQGLGTPDFLAPERIHDAGDVRSDVYSLGCTFYYLLTGQPPFAGGSVADKLHRHQMEDPPPLEQIRKDVSAEVRAVVTRAMAKHPDDRYQTPAEMAAVLLPLRGPEMASNWEWPSVSAPSRWSRLAAPLKPLVAPPARWLQAAAREPLWRMVGVAAVLLLVLSFGVWLALALSAGSVDQRETNTFKRLEPVPPTYVKKATRESTILATLAASGLPTFEGKWYYLGPFANIAGKSFDTVHPPERGVDLSKSCKGRNNQVLTWKEFRGFEVGKVVSLKLFTNNDNTTIYLYHEFEVREPLPLPISLGSDDTITVWLNGQKLLAKNVSRGAAPDQELLTLPLTAGKNQLLVKVCNGTGDFGFYIRPKWPASLDKAFGDNLRRDFPGP